MKINIIKVPMMFGSSKNGVEYGPRKIMEMGLLSVLEKYQHEIGDIREVYVPIASENDMLLANPKIKYYDEILQVSKDLAAMVSKYDDMTLVLGGDHALGLGSVVGSLQRCENLGVFWVDAHCDINTEDTTPSKNAHGMPLAFACGMGDKNFANIYGNKKLNPENIFIIGARDIDSGEYKICDEHNVNLYEMKDIRKKTILEVLEEALEKVKEKNIDKIHLSIDVDSLEKSLVPGTGTPVEGGFSMDELKLVIKKIIQSKKVCTIDIVELNPRLDKKNITAVHTMQIIDCILKELYEIK